MKQTTPPGPKKLLLSKWTAVTPVNREKHFLVTKLLEPLAPDGNITHLELEAVISKRVRTLPWRDLTDAKLWRRGWV